MRIERLPYLRPGFRSIFDLERDIDSVLDTVISRRFNPITGTFPALDVAEQNDATVVVAEIPGVAKDQLSIKLDKDVLTIGGERKPTDLPENSRWIRSETNRGRFTRSVQLSHPVKSEEISAELSNGILRVVLPKAENARPREVTIK